MTAQHAEAADRLYLTGESPLHGLAPQIKLVAAVLFIVVVVLTPAQWFVVFGWYGLLLAAAIVISGVGPTRILRRMTVEIPFVAFALLLPLVGREPEVEVLGMTLSEPGLLAAWNILAKATLGVGVSALLAATTTSRDLLDGLARLRAPALLIEIASFMVRYLHVVSDEWQRMAQARAARGFQRSGVRAWPTLARSAGVLFIRSYERGERVHTAMLARGYAGAMPQFDDPRPATAQDWASGLALPFAAAVGLALAAWTGLR